MKKTISIFILLLPTSKVSSSSLYLHDFYKCHNSSNRPDSLISKQNKWYDVIKIRGYTQIGYNKPFAANTKNDLADKFHETKNSFFIRRLRLVFFGNINPWISFYIQPDFAASISSKELNFAQIRDVYFDVYIDKFKEFRFRIGQSKIPYAFENMQSSQNRLPLDRSDALSSSFSNERDLGVFFYWTPKETASRFKYLVSSGLKGSGDYGMLGFGVFNGQGSNKPNKNNNLHTVLRFTYPFQIKNQILETSLQAYVGKYVAVSRNLNVAGEKDFQYLDKRIAGSIILYPRPFGIQAEYNIGSGPEYHGQTNSIKQKNLWGGYIMTLWRQKIKSQYFMPFVRYQYYHGGKEHETDAVSCNINNWDFGIEWQPVKYLELQASYIIADQRLQNSINPNYMQRGNLLSFQLQFNY